MKSEEERQYSSENECIFCDQDEETSDLYQMMNQALLAKHSNQNNNNYLTPIDIILKLQDPVTPPEFNEYAKYKELVFVDNKEQTLKRIYRETEFQGKINMLSQYYKFHKDIPRVIQPQIQKILGKYYDRKRQYDYKCIKKVLREEQGLSITSLQDSITQNSQNVELKSRYSTVLNGLDEVDQAKKPNSNEKMSDSNILEEICKEIGRALPKTKIVDSDFKGFFLRGQKNFEDFVKQQKKGKTKESVFNKKSSTKVEIPSNYFGFRKGNKESNQTTTKIKRQANIRPKNIERLDESKKKFIYNTNIKIEIQNALFYPDSSNNMQYQLAEGQKTSLIGSGVKIKPKKTLIGKVNNANEDRYRTPVSKIYQAQETDAYKYKKKRNISQSKERLRTKERQSRDYLPDRQRDRKILTGNSIRKMSLDKEKLQNQGTVSVGKLKIENNRKIQLGSRGGTTGPTRSGSTQTIRRRSVTLTQNNRQSSAQKIPLAKYSSSEIKDARRIKGVNIKDLLTKKLNIYER